jgi:predicted CxxxxCH...CXXCH cytochrome family protein
MTRLAGRLIPWTLAALLTACSDPQTPPLGGIEPSVHPPDWETVGSPEFHGAYIASTGYHLAECRTCHGSDYGGGLVGVTCRDCHTAPAGPEACNTCHGNFAGDARNLLDAAPPKGLDGETLPSDPGVGAHQRHLRYNPLRPVMDTCRECHRVPAEMSSPGHLDELGPSADVLFADSLAALPTESGARVPVPAYDSAGHTCSGTYCHGNWGLLKANAAYDFIYVADRIEGNSARPVWIAPQTAACGSCHGLPPTGHEPQTVDECGTCHDGVVNPDGSIADSTLHMNGQIDVFGEQYPMGH